MKNKIWGIVRKNADNIKRGLFLIASILVVGVIYQLEFIFIIISFAFTLFILPGIYRERLKEIREKRRFNCVIHYIEQILYSFRKKPKIRDALLDAQKTSEHGIKELIEEVIVNIDTAKSDDIYQDSLKIIHDEFPCRRIKSVHEFMIKMEKQGGEAERYIDMLLNDLKAWNDRTRMFIEEVTRVKRNVLISICATLLTCAFMMFLIPKDYSYTDSIIYQISTTTLLVSMLSVYRVVIHKLNFDWISEKAGLTQQQIDTYYHIIYSKRGCKEDPIAFGMIEKSNYKTAKKKLERELKKVFPDWIRDVAINLQLETVQYSIEHSYQDAPYILKEPIRRLMLDFEMYPVGIEPYDNFLKEFELEEIKSGMKMLYSMSELGKEEADVQISSILDRNIRLENQAEEMKNKDRIGIATFLNVVPMMIGVFKIMVDMLLMVMVFTSALSGVMEGAL